MSNQIYVWLASAMASSDYAGKHLIRELLVKFEKECFLNNDLEMTLYRKDDGSFATVIRREDMPEPVCVFLLGERTREDVVHEMAAVVNRSELCHEGKFRIMSGPQVMHIDAFPLTLSVKL